MLLLGGAAALFFLMKGKAKDEGGGDMAATFDGKTWMGTFNLPDGSIEWQIADDFTWSVDPLLTEDDLIMGDADSLPEARESIAEEIEILTGSGRAYLLQLLTTATT
jgi:hypothetical protein